MSYNPEGLNTTPKRNIPGDRKTGQLFQKESLRLLARILNYCAVDDGRSLILALRVSLLGFHEPLLGQALQPTRIGIRVQPFSSALGVDLDEGIFGYQTDAQVSREGSPLC